MKTHLVPFLVSLLAGASTAFAQNGKPDAEGFIRDWLVLAPFSISGGSGIEEIDKKQFADEAQPAAKEGGKQKIGARELTWKKVASNRFYLDFRELHPNEGEYAIGWAVAYLVSPDEKTGLTVHLNSNDQGKVYLNGKELAKFVETRTLEKDAEDKVGGVTLKKGVNVVVLKVINEENNWQGSLRFSDRTGKPVTDVKVQTQP
jgi:hypothetical protein